MIWSREEFSKNRFASNNLWFGKKWGKAISKTKLNGLELVIIFARTLISCKMDSFKNKTYKD